ncbi:MAG: hypothetical protein Q9170_007581 [Blastenia crenularia]
MGDYYTQQRDYYTHQREDPRWHGTVRHNQCHVHHDTYHSGWDRYANASSGPGVDPPEIVDLKVKNSTLEFNLAERKKELAHAQSVVSYLLQLNAGVSGQNGSCGTCKVLKETHDGSTTRVVAEIVKTISSAFVAVSSRHATSELEKPLVLHQRATPACGDLLSFGDTCPQLDTLISEKKGSSSDKVHETGTETQPLDILPEHGNDAQKQNLLCQEGGLSQDTFDFPGIPYVTRFTHNQNGNATCPAICSNLVHNRPMPVEAVDTIQSFTDNSSLNLSGSTQYDSSESTGPTSLHSSFHSSYEETEDLDPYLNTNDIPKKDVGQRGSSSSKYVVLPQDKNEITSSGQQNLVASVKAPKSTPPPTQVLASAFMPKWPVKTFQISPEERERAISVHQEVAGNSELRLPDIFKYGIRFRPMSNETDLYRTVVIDNLPRSTRLFVLLQQVSGGAIADAKLLDTAKISGGSSAIITFVHEHGAKSFEQQTRHHGLKFDGIRARVTLLPTPTYPISPTPTFPISKDLLAAIGRQQHTRCLEIRKFPRDVQPAELEIDLRVCKVINTHRIVSKRMRSDDALELHLSSIKYAAQAYGLFTSGEAYRQCKVGFAPDPCAQPWKAEEAKLPKEQLEKPHLDEVATKVVSPSHEKPANHTMLKSNPQADPVALQTSKDGTKRPSALALTQSTPKAKESCWTQ